MSLEYDDTQIPDYYGAGGAVVGFLLRAPLIKKSIVQILVGFYEEDAGAAMLKPPYHQSTANFNTGHLWFSYVALGYQAVTFIFNGDILGAALSYFEFNGLTTFPAFVS